MPNLGGMANAIEARGLRKRFGRATALDGLDLTVAAGEVHAFLGPNGAGKTTTIRLLLGLLRKDGGDVSLLGGDPWRDATTLHRRLAYVPGDVTLWPTMTGGEIIDLLARLRGASPAARQGERQRRQELIERFDLDPAKKARAYSKGNRQKVALIAALASDAELLVLDEPTSGLDPLMEAAFRDSVSAERRSGRGAGRPGDDHPGGPDGRDRHARRAAALHPHHGRRRAGRAARPGQPPGRPRRCPRRPAAALRGGQRRAQRGPAPPDGGRGADAHLPPADP
jgi:ABC-type Na+ transport system ATPase subunit NatA